MLKFWSVNYICQVCKLYFYFGHVRNFGQYLYLCSHFTQSCILLYFLEAKNPYFETKNCWKSSYICVFILSKKRRNWFHKNPHNSGTVGRRKLPDPSLNRIFNALSIGVQYMLSFQWTNFGLNCLKSFSSFSFSLYYTF